MANEAEERLILLLGQFAFSTFAEVPALRR